MPHHHHAIPEWPKSERPREQLLLRGPDGMTDAMLLAVLLRTGSKGVTAVDLARRVLTDAGGLHGLRSLTISEMKRFGLGNARSATLAAMFELSRRMASTLPTESPFLRSPDDVASRFGPKLCDLRHEEFWAILLTSANRIHAEVRISMGTLNASLAHPRECFAEAVQRRAATVIFVHNHPSGNPEPSSEDLSLTRQLVEAGKVLGIPVHDHVIIAGHRHTSFADRGLL